MRGPTASRKPPADMNGLFYGYDAYGNWWVCQEGGVPVNYVYEPGLELLVDGSSGMGDAPRSEA